MTPEQYKDSIKWKIGQPKQGAVAKPKKTSAEVIKRIVVGFCILAWYVFPMYVHPFCVAVVTLHMSFSILNDAFKLQRKEFEGPNQYWFRATVCGTMYYYIMPKMGILERRIVEDSGFTQ